MGDYVPFYFCPRSIGAYVIHKANHPISHTEVATTDCSPEADRSGRRMGGRQRRRWAALSNAGAVYTQFRGQFGQLADVNWAAVAATDFRPPEIKEGKQAEFLLHEDFPWDLVERIGVMSPDVAQRVANAMRGAAYRPAVEIRREWYY